MAAIKPVPVCTRRAKGPAAFIFIYIGLAFPASHCGDGYSHCDHGYTHGYRRALRFVSGRAGQLAITSSVVPRHYCTTTRGLPPTRAEVNVIGQKAPASLARLGLGKPREPTPAQQQLRGTLGC